MDNTTSCAYINKFGGKTEELDEIAREIWLWCIDKGIHLSAVHLPGKMNQEADKLSRVFNDDLEWSLNCETFKKIMAWYPEISVDLFASRLNNKLKNYVSLRPDPHALAVDAFSIMWTGKLYYIFAPFSLLAKILQKMEQDTTEAVLVVPLWPTQAWWPSLLHMISGPCFLLPKPQNILILHHKPEHQHPLTRMRLGVFRLSGKLLAAKEYREQLRKSSSNPGETPLKSSTTVTSNSGSYFVDGAKIPLSLL